MSKALCPGSFDPFTLGHLDVVRQALAFCQTVIIAVGQNSQKTTLFTPEERTDLVHKTLADASFDTSRIEVAIIGGLLVDYCKANAIDVIVKGLRSSGDYDAELPMAYLNRELAGIDTVFVPARPEFFHISSSLVKEVARFGANLEGLVSPGVGKVLYETLYTDTSSH